MTATTTSRSPVRTPWRQHALLHAVFFLMGAELFLLSPLLSTIAGDLHASSAATAWVLTAYVLTYAVASPPLAALCDRHPRKQVVLAGVVVFAVGDLACAAAPSLSALVAAHAISGLGGATAAPAIWAFLAETAAEDERGRAVARGAAMYSAGQILGVPLGALLAAGLGWRWAFAAVVLGLAVAAVAVACRLHEPVRGVPVEVSSSAALMASVRLWRRPTFPLTILATALTQAARLGSYTFLGVLYGHRFGFTPIELGLIGALVGLGSMTGSLLAGPAVDRWRRDGHSIATLGVLWAALLAVFLTVALRVHDPVVGIVAVVAWFAAGGACYSTAQAFLALTVPDRRAAAVSWNNAAMNGGVAIGTALLGSLAVTGTGFTVLAVSLAVVGGLVGVALSGVDGRSRR